MSGGDFSHWQANARGVDLNHNYKEGFDSYKAVERERGICPGPTLYSGEYPESEPESRFAASLVRALRPCLTVSLHSQGEELYFTERAAACAGWFSGVTGYSLSVAEGTAKYGGLTDYVGALGLAGITVELGRGVNPLGEDCIPRLSGRVLGALIRLPTKL